MIRLTGFLLLLALGTGCSPSPARRPAAPAIFPNSEQLALVNGEPLRVDGFLSVHENLKPASPEVSYWVSTAALAFRTGLGGNHPQLSLAAALELALYAQGARDETHAGGSLALLQTALRLPTPPSANQVKDFLEKQRGLAKIVRNDAIWAGLFAKK